MEEEKKVEESKSEKEVKRNYRVGYKKDILILTHKLGVVPLRSLRYLTAPTRPRMIQKAIMQMEEDGTVKIEKRGLEKVVALQPSKMQKQKYQQYIPEYIQNYYNNFSSRNLWKTSDKDMSAQIKSLRDVDAQMFFYSCGFKIGPDAKDLTKEMIGRKENSYYSSREFKRINGYMDSKPEVNNKIVSSRVNGLLLADSGFYTVYNIGNMMIQWRRLSESKLSMYVVDLLRNRCEYELDAKVKKEAIVLATSDHIFRQICELNYEKNRTYKTIYMNIDYVYDSIYGIPEDYNGKLLIEILSTEGWKGRIKHMLLDDKLIENGMFTNVPCDGYDEENETNILIFCIPDLVKLKAFVARANLECNKKKYKIYCYSYQIPLIVSLAGKNVEILKTDIEKFHKKFFEKEESELSAMGGT